MTPQAQTILDTEYSREWHGLLGTLTAIEQVLNEDFPKPKEARGRTPSATVTRYDLDMVRGMRAQLSAFLEGYERR